MSQVGKNKQKPGGYRKPKVAVEHTGFYPYLQRFIEQRQINNYSKETLRRQDSTLRKFIAWCDERGLSDPREVTLPILTRYKKHLYYQRKANGDPLSFNAQASMLSTLKIFFSWLTKHSYLLYNPAADLELPRRPKQLPRSLLSVEDIQTLLNAPDVTTVEGLRDRAVMEVLYSCGLRRQETGGLKLHDVNLKQGVLMVRSGKGNKDRMLPIGESAWRWLAKYLLDGRAELITGQDDGTLFISDYGEPMNGEAIGRLVKRTMKKTGLQVAGSAHLFRHAMATHMLENGADIRFIQAMLGHEDLRSTQVYTQVSVEKLREIHKATHPAKMGADQDDDMA